MIAKNPLFKIQHSTDGTFEDNSDFKSPSEKAIKTYVDVVFAASEFTKEDFTLIAGDITNKYITLASIPDNPDSIELKTANAGSQIKGISYELVGQTISWNGYSLEDLLEIGSVISIRYA